MSYSQNGSGSLHGDQDVALSNAADGQALVYNGSLSKWENSSLTESNIQNLSTDLGNRVQTSGGGQELVQITASAGTSLTINLASGNLFFITLSNSNCTLTFSGATNGVACSFTLSIAQGATTGNRTVTWPSSVKWPSGVAPTLSTNPATTDFFSFLSKDGGTTWYGFISGIGY